MTSTEQAPPKAKVTPPASATKAEQAAKQAEQQREARQLDSELRAAAHTAIDSLARFAYLIEQAEKLGVWKLVKDAEGKPYRSHHGYVTDVLAAETDPATMAPQYRNALVKVLLESGLSQRAAAEIAKTSKSTVDRIAQGETPGERNVTPKPNTGGSSSQPKQQTNVVDRAYDALDRVVRRAQTYPDDLPIQDVERLIPKLKQATTALNKLVKDYQAAVTEAQKRHPAGGKSASPAA